MIHCFSSKTLSGLLIQGMLVIIPVLMAFHTATSQQPTGESRPNIIHILVSDIGYDEIGIYGSRDSLSPHLDLLARRGVRLTGFYSPHASYTASLTAVLTGRYAPRVNQGNGIQESLPGKPRGFDPAEEVTIAELLLNQGYTTGFVGQWNLGQCKACLPSSHGFGFFAGIPYSKDFGPERMNGTGLLGYPLVPVFADTAQLYGCNKSELAELPAYMQREACRFIYESVQKAPPFFLMYAPVETHVPWMVPEGLGNDSRIGSLGNAVSYLDRTVGILMDLLKELGIENNTLIVFSSGNGSPQHLDLELENCYGRYASFDTNRYRTFRGGKYQSRYEGGMRVPCIIAWPGKIHANQTSDLLSSGFDLFATFAAVAGAPLPVGRVIDGKDLMPSLIGLQTDPVHLLFFGFEPSGQLMSVRYKNWKLALPASATDGAQELTDFELFQLTSDPREQMNVAARFPEIVDQLRQFGEKARQAIRENSKMPERNFIE